MKFILIILALSPFLKACEPPVDGKGKAEKTAGISSDKISDTLFVKNDPGLDTFFRSGVISSVPFKKYETEISYKAGSNGNEYSCLADSVKIEFKNKFSGNEILREILFNNKAAEIKRIKEGDGVSAGNLTLDYREGDLFIFPERPGVLLVVLHPANFTGLMTNYSLYQLLNIKDRKIVEFISFGDYPGVIADFNGDNSMDIFFTEGVHHPERDVWNLYITRRNSSRPSDLMDISLQHDKAKYKCIAL